MHGNIPDAAALLAASHQRSRAKRDRKPARFRTPPGVRTVTLIGVVTLLVVALVAGTNAVLMAVLG
jgi:hypothetical protein